MKRPDGRTMFLAHPAVSTPLSLAGFAGLYSAYNGGSEGLPLGLAFVLILAAVGKARSEAGAYLQWRRDWDAMDGEAPAPGARTNRSRERTALGALIAFGVWSLWWVTSTNALGNLAVMAVPAAIAIAVIASWRTRRCRSARPKKVVPVQIVAEPTGPVPTLEAAYAGLPEHLRSLVRHPHR